jgi:uncharacterized iron-regulated membrane protein
MILIVLIAILAVLMFGPAIGGLMALAAAIGAGVVATFFILLFGLFAFAILLGVCGWCIWWACDPKGATEALRAEQRDHARRSGR